MTTSPAPGSPPAAPDWPHCGLTADPVEDPVGCRGRVPPGHRWCLRHLAPGGLDRYLAGLAPGSDVDHRGTTFTRGLLIQLLAAMDDGTASRRPRIGKAQFDGATFIGDAEFARVTFANWAGFAGASFTGDASFRGAVFTGPAWFDGATFTGDATFGRTRFASGARFTKATFTGDAQFGGAAFAASADFSGVTFTRQTMFDEATFGHWAVFEDATFADYALFLRATFTGDASFSRAAFTDIAELGSVTFRRNARFVRTAFRSVAHVGPFVCAGSVDFSQAVFDSPVTIETAARAMVCRRTRWAATATLRLRYATVDLTDTVIEYPLSVATHSTAFEYHPRIDADETQLLDGDPWVKVVSVSGVDAAHLLLSGVDLSQCRFAGTFHLDQIRLEGRYAFAAVPPGLRRRGTWPARWTPRRTLIEEHHWRATRFADTGGWTAPEEGETVLGPAALAPVYRQLRKSFEDSKHEPGAADFYYGEMTMRRHADDIPPSERGLLTAYWALSGYGLRASRALGWLLTAMTATVLAMMLWGLPRDAPEPHSTGALTGRHISLRTDTPEPVNPGGPLPERLTDQRFEKALRVVVNSVVFHSSGQDLTTTGTYTEMGSRIGEPVLLGLAVLAIRGRIKR